MIDDAKFKRRSLRGFHRISNRFTPHARLGSMRARRSTKESYFFFNRDVKRRRYFQTISPSRAEKERKKERKKVFDGNDAREQ